MKQIEVSDCSLGFLGSLLELAGALGLIDSLGDYGGALYCDWKQYRFPKPLFRFGVDTVGLG